MNSGAAKPEAAVPVGMAEPAALVAREERSNFLSVAATVVKDLPAPPHNRALVAILVRLATQATFSSAA